MIWASARDQVVRHGLLVVSGGLIAGLTVLAILERRATAAFFESAQALMAQFTGWLLIFIMNAVLVFVAYLAIGPQGQRRIGGPDARPEYSRLDWFGMLFAAGMGIGLLFYSVAEPIQHFLAFEPYFGDRATAARVAMEMTFLHWGLHPWAMYALVGLALAFFRYSRSQGLDFEAPLHELMPPARARWFGGAVNLAAILGTVFGVCTSLGLGAAQAAAGIARLSGVAHGPRLEFAVIGFVCAVAMGSVLAGVGRGIRRFSLVNLYLASALLAFVLVAGNTLFVLKALGEHLGNYLNDLLVLATWNETYTGTNWQERWTVFYWSWWIAWSPFVGMFIAQISRGRTIREYVAGVVLVPTAFNCIWMTVFGANALYLELFQATGLAGSVEADPSASLYAFLGALPWQPVSTALAVTVVMLFFVTSADSGALVVSTLTSNGNYPSALQRGFWTLVIGAIAAALLNAGGLSALQAATISAGLPFGIVVLALIPALWRALNASPR